jgi:hypothetical protein
MKAVSRVTLSMRIGRSNVMATRGFTEKPSS